MKNTACKLRDYQSDLVSRVFASFKEHRRVMLQLPTGGGKTVIFSAIALNFLSRGQKILVLAHRSELISQAADKMRAIAPNSSIGVIKADIKPNYSAPIQVASVQSLARRLHHLNSDEFGLIVIDEAHHATADTYRHILSSFPNAYQLGVSATPIRTNGEGFTDLFEDLIPGITVSELIQQRYLSPFKLYASPKSMTTKGAKTHNGDFAAGDISRLNDVVELAGDLLQTYRQYAAGLSCVVFAVNVAHSVAIAHRYNVTGIPAAHLDGNTPKEERKVVLEEFRQGKIKIISNVGLFTEGLDVPSLQAVQIARPTKSLVLWLQMLGRCLRPFPGKSHAIILDHTLNYAIHGLPTRPRVWSLFGVEQQQQELVKNPDGEMVVQIEEKVIHETKVKLVEIAVDDSGLSPEYWSQWLKEQIRVWKFKGYQKGWVYHRLAEAKPPIEIWLSAAECLGYKSGWAFHAYKECCG